MVLKKYLSFDKHMVLPAEKRSNSEEDKMFEGLSCEIISTGKGSRSDTHRVCILMPYHFGDHATHKSLAQLGL